MSPDEPPALQPEEATQSRTPPKPLARRNYVFIKPLLLGVGIALVVAFIMWTSFFSPQAMIGDALQNLKTASHVQAVGTVATQETEGSGQSGIEFSAKKQPGSFSISGTLTLSVDGEQATLPLEVLVDGAYNSYIKSKGNGLSSIFIRNANPDTALKLLNADAVFNTVIKDKWLRLTPAERAAVYRRPFAHSTFNVLPAQSCLAVLLDGESRANTTLIQSFAEIMATQGVRAVGEEVFGTQAYQRYRTVIEPSELQNEWSKLLASSNVKAFNDCAGRQPGITVPKITSDMWIDTETRQLRKFSLQVATQPRSVVLTTDIAYDRTSEVKLIPADYLTVKKLQQQLTRRQAAINRTFEKRLSAFPELQALVHKLKQVEDLQQGL